MKDKIIGKATEMFLKYGFKSITMDDIAANMGISKKTIYKYYANKEVMIAEATQAVHATVQLGIETIISQGFNPIAENFEIRRMFKGMFQASDTSPLYQLKKHYPEIYAAVCDKEKEECYSFIRQNLERGIAQGYYRPEIIIDNCMKFYFTLIFTINETVVKESDAQLLELAALEYHTRAIATAKGIAELEKHLNNTNL